MARVKVQFNQRKIIRKAEQANFNNLFPASAAIRTTAKRSIRPRKDRSKSSPEGAPPFTHSKALPRSIFFAVNKSRQESIIGTDSGMVGRFGERHEKGGVFQGERFPQRAFMVPAFEKIKSRLPRMWADSVK